MIKIENNTVELDGKPMDLIGELAEGLASIITTAAEETETSKKIAFIAITKELIDKTIKELETSVFETERSENND